MTAYSTLRFVDMVGNNFLFRGGNPVQSGVFDYDGLTNAMASAPDLPQPLPKKIYLVVLSLLHASEQDIGVEVDYFGDPETIRSKGQLQLWDTYGTPFCYFSLDPGDRRDFLKTFDQWLEDPLVWRTATLRSWLEQKSELLLQPANCENRPLVFYVHCDGGCDRTGEMIGAYRLRYMNWSWKQMWEEQPCGAPPRPMGCNNYRALQWFAFWLNETQGGTITGIGDDGGCADGDRQFCDFTLPGRGIVRACYDTDPPQLRTGPG